MTSLAAMPKDPRAIHFVLGATIAIQGLPDRTYELLRQTLHCPNPAFRQRQRFGRGSGHGRVGDTGDEPRFLEVVTRLPGGTVHVPRGLFERASELLRGEGWQPIPVRDTRVSAPPDPDVVDHPEVPYPPLHDYQEEAVGHLLRIPEGLIVLPPGTGKTRIATVAIRRLGRRALVIVPTIDIADQWVLALAAVGIGAGRVGGGLDQRYFRVVVGVDDSIDALLARDPAWGTLFDVLVVDEAHHAASATYRRMLARLPCPRRYGLTATPEREDDLSDLVLWSFGPVLLRRTTAQMIRAGFLHAATVEAVPTRFLHAGFADPSRPTPKELAALEADLAEDLVRNSLIADRVAARARAGTSALVLCGRRSHCAELADLIGARGVGVRSLTGKSSKRARTASVAGLRDGSVSVLCATSLADEGLDVPRLGYLALAAPLKARSVTLQRLGRLLRTWEGKKPHLDDFVDDHVPVLARRAAARRAVFREAGCWQDTPGLFG